MLSLWRPFGPQGPSLAELTRQALSSTEGGYDLLAPRFDATPFRTPDPVIAGSLRRWGPGIDAALDLCCGTGAALQHLARLAPSARLVGMDISQGMLDEARRRWTSSTSVELLQGDVLDPPPPLYAAFDLVTCYGAFGHIERRDETRFVSSVHRLLKPGGRFVFVTSRGDGPHRGRALARVFNGVMRVRNALWRPRFVMYYLTFELSRAKVLLEWQGFDVRIDEGALPEPYPALVNVVATKRP